MAELTYTMQGDYNLPDLTMPEQPEVTMGRYAQMRKKYLKEQHRILYYRTVSGTIPRRVRKRQRQRSDRFLHPARCHFRNLQSDGADGLSGGQYLRTFLRDRQLYRYAAAVNTKR